VELDKVTSVKDAALKKIDSEAKLIMNADILIQKNQDITVELQEERQARKNLQAILSGKMIANAECDKSTLKLLQDQHNSILENEQLIRRLRDEIDHMNMEKGEIFKEIISCRTENRKLVGEIVRLNNELRMPIGERRFSYDSPRVRDMYF
jgi:hypothetical protein